MKVEAIFRDGRDYKIGFGDYVVFAQGFDRELLARKLVARACQGLNCRPGHLVAVKVKVFGS